MEKNPDDWPLVIAPDAFDGIDTDKDVPLRWDIDGPVIGTAHTKSTPEGVKVTMRFRRPNDTALPQGSMSFKAVPPEED